MAEKNFAITPSVSISRSKFLRTSQHKTAFNLGAIVPIYIDEVLPGDTRSIDIAALVRMSTPIAPIMDDIELEFFAFSVPKRLCWNNWKRFMGEAAQAGYDTTTPVHPYMTYKPSALYNALNAGTNGTPVLGDYFGLPCDSADTNDVKVDATVFRAYALIYNRWFRDQNVEAPSVVSLADGADSTTFCGPLSSPFVAYKKSDYFTRALPYAQKGNPVTLPLGIMAPIKSNPVNVSTGEGINLLGNGLYFKTSTGPVNAGRYGLSIGYGTPGNSNGEVDVNNVVTSSSPIGTITGTNLIADLSQATAATINQIREAFQLQKLLEKDALYGTRYWEILYGHFGVRSPDATLQDPEYLGGHRCMINVDQVLQTTGSDVSTPSNNSLGTPGANSVTGTKGSLFTKSFVEHGWLFILAVARQKSHTYGQGLNRMWQRFDRYDYYWPEFANLGAQEVKEKEIYIASTTRDAVFGWQEAWAEYRYKPSIASSVMKPSNPKSLAYWTLTDAFGSKPTLSTSFLKETRANLARSLVTGINGPDFIGDFYFRDTAVRAMPLYSIPGLIDHH